MSEASTSERDLAESGEREKAALQKAARAMDWVRMRQIGGYHFAMVVGALTLWGAAVTWAQLTGWMVAEFAALGGALVAGFVLPSTLHEWGHFAGARLSGAQSPVLKRPRGHFFMFDFPMDQNDARQFLWMSWGGILVPWAIVVLALVFVPLSLLSGLVLIATLISRAVAITVFEGPIAGAVARGGAPGKELARRVKAGGLGRAGRVGNWAGWLVFVLLWVVT